MISVDFVLISLALMLSVSLYTHQMDISGIHNIYPMILLSTSISIAFFVRFGLYHAVLRFMGNEASVAVAKGVALSALTFAILASFLKTEIHLATTFIYACIALCFITYTRLTARGLVNNSSSKIKKNIAVYGAGQSGISLLGSLKNGCSYNPVVLVDDRSKIRNISYHGIKVESPENLPGLIKTYGIQQVLLAMPSVSNERKKSIIKKLEHLPVKILTVPTQEELMAGTAKLEQIQDIKVEDLLGRTAVKPIPALLGRCIEQKTVMVTGAGGSIGSELCRQIIKLKPKCLILVERCEMALYQIDQELSEFTTENGSSPKLIPLLACVQNRKRMRSIFSTFDINTVYHTAAYKHVPIVEYNMTEGVRNNVMGTYETALAAMNAKVETFVLISTDKAVRPTNIMGASKRLAELALQSLAKENTATRFCMVRFGNVLASSGSVVPLFRKQIESGGPVTVTHPEIIRYFMTIPEASQLVLQAGAMAEGGDVFVLNMGKPVKIIELAETMIRLMGLSIKDNEHPAGDIEITCTGLRPGEKLFEELLVGKTAYPTEHSEIMRANEDSLDREKIEHILQQLNLATEGGDCAAIKEILVSANTGYCNPASEINDHLWVSDNKDEATAPLITNQAAANQFSYAG